MIYANVELTVQDTKTVANNNIVLYRGDKNVEIRFVIKENRFTVLDSTYAQMIIRRPSSLSIFSEPAAILNDTVVLTITGDMIDELKEIGEYTFQIRLYDNSMNARATLPPCKGCLIINHPIAVEGEAIVNAAMVNNSAILSAVPDTPEEEIFTDDNAYNRTVWVDGDIITDARMNKIEDALYYVNEKTDHELYATKEYVEEYVEEEINEVPRVVVSTTKPTEKNVTVWLNPDDEAELNIGVIDDNSVGVNTVWSSSKVNEVIINAKIEGEEIDHSEYITETELTAKGYLTSIPSMYVTEAELSTKNYATQSYVTTAISNAQLSGGDSNVDLSGYATKDEIPTKTSQLTNDSGYLTLIPSEYLTEAELSAKGYATQSFVTSEIAKAQLDGGEVDLSGYATKDELHSHTNKTVLDGITSAKVTAWDNKSTFDGNYNSLTNKPTIPTVTNDLTNALKSNYDTAYTHSQSTHAPTNAQKNSDITKAEIEAKLTGTITSHTHNYLSSIPSEYITETELSAKGYATQSYVTDNEIVTTFYGTSESLATDEEKIITVDDPKFTLRVGTILVYKANVTNTASNVKFNVNGTGAYPIWYNASEYTSTSGVYCGYLNRPIMYMFNGTHWVWIQTSYYVSYTPASLGFGYGVCDTAEATVAKAVTISSYTLVSGGIVAIKFTYAVPANATLNIRTRGAKKIFYNGSAITSGVIKAGDTVTLQYDGTQYQVINIDRDYSSEINALRNEMLGEINNIATLLGGDA